jgi:hypothetical protein
MKQIFECSLLLGLLLCSSITQGDVWQQLKATGICDRYLPMSEEQLHLAESLFTSIFRAKQIRGSWLSKAWSKLGYGVVEVPAAGDDWIGLQDLAPGCRGQGFFLLNRRPEGPLVVQVPHAYYDLYSGEIAAGLLREDIAIIAWNSAKRTILSDPDDSLADLAKRHDSLFNALTQAMLETRPQGRLIQLHGFANEKRITEAGAEAAVIVSNGSVWPSTSVEQIAGCLQSLIDGPVWLYPKDVRELGATQNVQGQTMRDQGHDGFVHLELNRATRETLRNSPLSRGEFSTCLGTGLD